ncbi:hypothetical protein E1B28_010961 [Marasmius oreades]|uniref:Mucoidy inhibitor A n=1 Tax=Marasmius oreades TaxID=181124 RepID=A0A9P7RUG7_9AGAR|nr:uncharacterized protein E1B28_010961 [Marasmius oreades]KAG7089263.1 hypothetical protein E1B28_010961 [Marasmius oreades]
MSTENTTSSHTELVRALELVSVEASNITNVNLYPGCAEITRVYRFGVQKGQNLVNIRELPWTMELESLRVKSHLGSTKINNVTVDRMLGFSPPKPLALVTAQRRKNIVEKQLDRVKKTSLALDCYTGTFRASDCSINSFEDILKRIRSSGEMLDEEILGLEDELRTLNEEIQLELERHEAVSDGQKPFKATISMLVEDACDMELRLVYTVNHAKWTPAYDMHVNLKALNSPVSLTYKAMITQNTGENWTNVPLTLRTMSPSTEIDLPILESWPLTLTLPEHQSSPLTSRKRRRESTGGTPARKSGTYDKRNVAYEEESSEEAEEGVVGAESGSLMDANTNGDEGDGNIDTLGFPEGNVSVTFKIPGGATIISNNAVHQALIADLKLEARLEWSSIPKGDSTALVKAQLRNTSEYPLLPSTANVYVDDALHARSGIPGVPPTSTFECTLGLDPSLRITYHPAVKHSSTTGFYNKSRAYNHIQRITIHNMKHLPLKNLKIFDHMPIPENPQVSVKLINPALRLPGPGMESGNKAIPSVKVSEGVVAQWAGSDEPDADVRNLGKDGKISWLCDLPAQGTIELVLQWEVLTPPDAQIVGLY